MEKQHQKRNNQKGMTLVELLISLLILGLISASLFPLFVMINKSIQVSRVRLIAANLANAEIENLLGRITPQNYATDLPDGLQPAETKIVNGISFQVQKNIFWIDDPSDGKSPEDPIPFDYKGVKVSVSAPDYFSGEITKYADFKTNVSREGADDPYSGLIVNVVRGWSQEPVEDADVTMTPADPGSTISGESNQDGQVIMPLDLSQDQEDYSILVEKSGMMMLPGQVNLVTASRWETHSITILIEEESSITLNFPGNHEGGQVTLSPTSLLVSAYQNVKTINPGQTSVSFDHLWPVGGTFGFTYTIDLQLYRLKQPFISDGGFSRWKEFNSESNLQNLWKYQTSAHCWDAKSSNYASVGFYGDGENQLLSPSIGLSNWQVNPQPGPGISPFTLSAKLNWHQNLNRGGSPSLAALVYKSNDGSTWQPLLALDDQVPEGDSEQQKDLVVGSGSSSDLTDNFRLRFDSSPSLNSFTVDNIDLQCQYSNSNITFSQPGESLTLQVAQP